MGVSITITDAVFIKPVASLTLPFRDGLVDEYLFGGTSAASIRNLGTPSRPLVIGGDPGIFDGYVRLGTPNGSNPSWYDMGVPPTEPDQTMIFAIRSVGASIAPIMYANSPPNFGVAGASGRIAAFNGQNATTSSLADLPLPGKNNFELFVAKMPIAQKASLIGIAAGVITENVAEVAGGNSRGQVNMIIGTNGTGNIQQLEIAYAARFKRILSNSEVSGAYNSLKAYLSTRGVTVL